MAYIGTKNAVLSSMLIFWTTIKRVSSKSISKLGILPRLLLIVARDLSTVVTVSSKPKVPSMFFT
jgi:hypothetical protein